MRSTINFLAVLALIGLVAFCMSSCERHQSTEPVAPEKSVSADFGSLDHFSDGTARGFIAIPLKDMKTYPVKYIGRGLAEIAQGVPYAEMEAYVHAIVDKKAFRYDIPESLVGSGDVAPDQSCGLVCGNTVYVVTGCPSGSVCKVSGDCLTISSPGNPTKGLCCNY